MLASLGRLAHRRPVLVGAAWLVLLLLGLFVGGQVFDRLEAGMGVRADVESAQVARLLAAAGGTGPDLLVLLDGRSVDDRQLAAGVAALAGDLRAMPDVETVTTAADPATEPGLVAEGGTGQVIAISLRPGVDQARSAQLAAEITSRAEQVDVPRVLVGGPVALQRDFQVASEQQLARGELIALPLVLVLLLLAFRGLFPALLPLLVAPGVVLGALLVLLGLSYATTLSAYAVNVIIMVGLALSIDYALLLVSRFREERAAGHPVEQALARTMTVAGRTVVFSGVTVVVALTGLLVFAEPLLRSMAWGAIGAVLLAIAAALTLLPALLGRWGRRLRPARAAAGHDTGGFYRLARLVQRSPALLTVLLVAVLVLLATPVRHAEWGGSGPETLPASSPTRQLAETMRERFPGGGSQPIVAVAELHPSSTEAEALAARIGALPGVAAVRPRPAAPAGLTVLDVLPQGPSQGAIAKQLVRDLRALDEPVRVGGTAAALIDFQESVRDRLPWALALIILATCLLLFLMTGSVVMPIKAVVMNVLSLGASFGALVWIFQEGHLSGLLQFEPVDAIDSAVPLLIFVFAFGLSMDYEVFLLSRIKETYDRTGDNDLAVAVGLQRSGRVVTAAAAVMVAVFLGFAVGDVLTVKQIGIGMAVAILVDATIVRCLLVPALMKLMGRWNWWAPRFLRRLHSRAALREGPSAPSPDPRTSVRPVSS